MKIHRKVPHIEENHDEGTYNLVRNNKSSLYTGFVIYKIRYIRDSLYGGNLYGVRQNPRWPDIFLLYRKISYSQVSYYQDSTVG